MILLLKPTKDIDIDKLDKDLKKCCKELNVTCALRPSETITGNTQTQPKDRVIITVIGSDKIGIVANVTKVLAEMNINIVELTTAPSYIIQNETQYTMIARVEVDDNVDMPALRSNLEECAQALQVEINIQNQEIFNAMHKI